MNSLIQAAFRKAGEPARRKGTRRVAATAALLAVSAFVAVSGNVAAAGGDETTGPQPKASAGVENGILEVKGTSHDDTLTLRLAAGNSNVVQVDFGDDGIADFTFDAGSFSAINIDGRSGNDLIQFDESNGKISKATTTFGGSGDDTILGGAGVDTIYGGSGDDFIDGNGGTDVAFMGSGNDTFRWDPGDGSDVVEGQAGKDTLLFNGANGGETVDLSANGERFRFFRQPGNITMDTDGVEISVFNALGGSDVINVNDLTGTDVNRVDLNLDAGQGSGVGDLVADSVTLNGTPGNDTIDVQGSAHNVEIDGLAATVSVRAADAADSLKIETGAGNDIVDAGDLDPGTIQLFVDGVHQ